MIFWSGGFIVVFIFAGQAAAYLLATYLSGDPDYVDLHGWPLGAGYFASAGMCWLLDARAAKSLGRAELDSRTGQPRRGWLRSFASRPILWCGSAMVVIGVLLCFYHRTPEQLWRSRQAQASRMEARRTMHQPPGTP